MKNLFVWDFHGTLEEGVEVGFCDLLKQLSKIYPTDVAINLKGVRQLYGTSIADYLRHYFPKYKLADIKNMMDKIAHKQSQNHLKKYVVAAPHAAFVLAKIKKAGHKNIIVTNSHLGHINPLIDIVGICKLIDEVFAIDRHYTYEKIDPVKEKAKILQQLSKDYQIPNSRIIAIGDSHTDINAGLAAGVITYQFINRHFPPVKTNAKYKIMDLREILKEI